ncbi:hypothetical protein AB0M58_14360 [Streptomyces bobili]|uniref:hypothetical protein n=1 Tax=Streptomyces bobili TaxID=67280 RepID=UPI0034448940
MARQKGAPGGTRVLGGVSPAATTPPSATRGLRVAVIVGGAFCLLVVIGLLVGGGGGGGGGGATATVTAEASAGNPVVKEPVGGNASISAHRTVDGVPVGYPRSQAGAVKAAVNYQLARSSTGYLADPAARAKTLRAMATSSTYGELRRSDDEAAEGALTSLGLSRQQAEQSLVSRSAVLGTRVVTYVPEAASVELWMAGIVGVTSEDSPLPVTGSWTTVTISLQWQNGDWKLSAIQSQTGPTPVQSGSEDPTDIAEFQRTHRDFDAPPYTD